MLFAHYKRIFGSFNCFAGSMHSYKLLPSTKLMKTAVMPTFVFSNSTPLIPSKTFICLTKRRMRTAYPATTAVVADVLWRNRAPPATCTSSPKMAKLSAQPRSSGPYISFLPCAPQEVVRSTCTKRIIAHTSREGHYICKSMLTQLEAVMKMRACEMWAM